MDAAFLPADRLPRETLRRLATRSDGPGLKRFAVQVSLLLIFGAVTLLAPAGWPLALAVLLLGAAHFTFFGPLHECAHGTAFRSPGLQRVVGWTAALLHLMGPALMRSFHFAHHRHTHDLEQDPELGGMAFMARWPRGLMALGNHSGLPILVARSGWTLFAALGLPARAWEAVLPFVAPADRRGVIRDSRLLVLAHALFIAAALTWYPPLLRLYLGVWLGHALLSVYITCEHRGLPMEGDILERTRSFGENPVLNWFLWNMPFHAEHHAWPAIPFHALPDLHAAMEDQLVHDGRGVLALHLAHGE